MNDNALISEQDIGQAKTRVKKFNVKCNKSVDYSFVSSLFWKFFKQQYTYFSIDPGMNKVAICVISHPEFKIIDTFILELKPIYDLLHNDLRVKYIYEFVESLIVQYAPKLIIVEKVGFSSGRFPFSEAVLIKSYSAILLSALNSRVMLFEMSSQKSQLIVFGRRFTNSKKDKIREFVQSIVKCTNTKKILNVKKNTDISDAIFIAYSVHKSMLEYNNKMFDLLSRE